MQRTLYTHATQKFPLVTALQVMIRVLRLPVLLSAFLFPLLASCSLFGSDSAYDPEVEPGVYQFDFETGSQGWESLFAAYFVEYADQFELEADHRSLPASLDASQEALFISGNNASDALYMFFKRHIEELKPNTTYQVAFEVEIASQVGTGCVGGGGAPGESVDVMGLALPSEPTKVEQETMYVLNESTRESIRTDWERERSSLLGNITNDLSCEESFERGGPFRLKRLESAQDFWRVQADEEGGVWLLVGTSSGFEGKTSLYYNEITVRFEAQS